MQMFPDFIVIGAQRAATTWLYRCLKEHPDTRMSPIKELHYFDVTHYEQFKDQSPTILERIRDKGTGFYNYNYKWKKHLKTRLARSIKHLEIYPKWDYKYFFKQKNDFWYGSLFNSKNKVTGEITPDYSRLDEKMVKHIHDLMPDTKILFIMRNPIERAWSQAKKDLCKNYDRNIKDVSNEEFIAYMTNEPTMKYGNYLKIINTWRKYYKPNQFFIGFFDDIVRNPNMLLRNVFNFLNIDESVKLKKELIQPSNYNELKSGTDIPEKVLNYLCNIYIDDIYRLHKKYGGYTENWLNFAKKYSNKNNN